MPVTINDISVASSPLTVIALYATTVSAAIDVINEAVIRSQEVPRGWDGFPKMLDSLT